MIVAGFVEKDGKLLVIRERVPHGDPSAQVLMNQPAGHVEKDEFYTEAVVREVLEETGYHVKPIDIVRIYQTIKDGNTWTHISFRCELTDDNQYDVEAPEVQEVLWLTQDQVMSQSGQHRSTSTTIRFQDFFDGHSLPLSALNEIDRR